MEEKKDMYSFSTQEVGAVAETDIKMLPIVELHDFEGHPFKVEHDMELMFQILEQEKPNQREMIKIPAKILQKYIPKEYTPKEKIDLIERLVMEWYEKKEGRRRRLIHPQIRLWISAGC